MCEPEYMCTCHASESTVEARAGYQIPGAGVSNSPKSQCIGAGKETWVLCKSNKSSKSLNHVSRA